MLSNRIKTLFFFDKVLYVHQNSRFFARWSSRKPAKVISSENYDEKTDSVLIEESIKPKWNKSFFKNKSVNDKNQNEVVPLIYSKRLVQPKITIDMLDTTMDKEGNFIYTKLNNNDTRITTVLTEIKSNKDRGKKGLMLLEGKRLIKDALDANCKLQYILFSRLHEIEYFKSSLPKIGAKLYKLPYKEIQMWSNLTTSPGIMGIFKIPDVEAYVPSKDTLPLTVICDNIREADNLGAVLRSCSGVGCEQILLTKGCVNIWDSKVLRSACGAHFKLKIKTKCDLDHANELLPSDLNIYIADNKTVSLTADDETEREEVLSNVVSSVPLLPYYGLNFNPNKHNVLIVGGETEGISYQSYKLVSELNGVRLNIPLGNNIDSLNVGTAFGIIVFEMKRQFLISQANKNVNESSKSEYSPIM